ncbi:MULTISPECIES: alcohol dehydrogenase catalytic domain-containing protein [unclassified Mesorhizobium]|uniref:alcohol dehydrogenase catalytic domain-containing protein n=1 Tax=unclassified Mesorhizobium TaxID=325217 RepID=UPI0013DFB0AC|nr:MULTISPECIES: alcohol dehydrogenase catalytic domain-containing protein [unclassified Mesorhizobium]
MLKSRTVMKVSPGAGNLGIDTRMLAPPREGEVLLKIKRAAICGTDLHIYHWNDWAARNYETPLVLGHEFCAEVLETGPGVTSVSIGQIVSGETHLFCDRCEQCRANRRHTCLNLRLFSKSGFGCFSDYSVVPANALRVVPDRISMDTATVLEPLGVGVRAAMEGDVSGRSVLVTGCGPIGLYTIVAARALGAASITAVDLSKRRLEMAIRAGADEALAPQVPPEFMMTADVDLVIDASGSADAIESAMEMIKPGGKLLLVGLPGRNLSIPPVRLINREITVTGIYGRLIDETWLEMERLLTSGRLRLDAIETCEFPMTEFDAAFERAASGTTGKVLFNLDS